MTRKHRFGRIARTFGIGGFAAAIAIATASAAQLASPIGYDLQPAEAAPEPEAEEAAPEAAAAPSRPRLSSEISPYLELDQVVTADFNDGDVLTYTTVAAGVDGRIETRRMTAQLSYRYERNIAWEGDLGDQDVHSGIALVNAHVVPGLLDFDAGALATRTGGEGRALGVTDREDSTNIYSVYAGPTVSTRAGPVAVNAAYRLGYVRIDDDTFAGGPAEDYNDAIAHNATASVGMEPGRLPFGWTVGAGYTREDSGELENRFEGHYVRGDVVVPVSPTLALTAGVGYENIEASQQDVLRGSNGLPVLTPRGRLIADPSRPRLLTYDLDGIMYDGGVIWRPTPRTELQARAGRRYGGTTVTASLQHRFSGNYGVNAVVYDTVAPFGQRLITNISNLPSAFDINRNPLTGDLGVGGCVFGQDPGTGVCFDQALNSINSAPSRARGGSILFSGGRGLWDFGIGAGYAHQRYFRPVSGDLSSLGPREDEGFSIQGNVGRELSRTSEINFDAYASWYDSDARLVEPVFSTGLTAGYERSFMFERLQLLAALGIYHSESDSFESTSASGLVGLRYNF